MKTPNTIYHNATVTRERRNQLNGHKSVVIWFTGLSGSGKSTLAHSVEEELHNLDCRPIVTGNFTRNEVMKYFDYEVHQELKNADYLHENGFFCRE